MARPTPQSLAALLRLSALPAVEACAATHAELVARLSSQVELCDALVGDGERRGAPLSALKTLQGLHRGVLRDLGAIAPLVGADAKLELAHRELMRAESRHALTLTSVVDVLSEAACGPGALGALEAVARQHVGAALLLRHHLASHAAHLENLPSARRGAAGPSDEVGAIHAALPVADSVRDAAREVELLADSAAVKAGVAVPTVELAGDLDAAATAPPHHVGQILMELLKNAFRATLEGPSPTAPVRVDIRSRDGGVEVAVKDSGAGVAGGSAAFADLARFRAGRRWNRVDEQTSYAAVPDPLHGIGVGLPVATFHAAHFEGNALLLTCGEETVATLALGGDAARLERLPDTAAALQNLLS